MTTMQVSTARSNALYLLRELPPDPNIVGSKAANLVWAASLGLKIPETAVIPTQVYNRLVPWNGLFPPEVRRRIESLDLASLARDVKASLLVRFGEIRFAVRSSSNLEDRADRSFAGQYESFLDVPLEDIEQAIRGCWLSLWCDEAVSYRGASATRPSMAVMIQPFLRGRLGGVAFSADPITGNPFQIVIDHVEGDPSGVTDGSARTQSTKVGLHEVVLRKAAEPFQTIAEACVRFGRPVDVEWIWDDRGGLSVLQVRPITGVRRFGAHDAMLSCYCLPIPEPLSRFGASLEFEKNRIYQQLVRRLSAPGFRSKMLTVYGRLYLFEEQQGSASKTRTAVGLVFSVGHILPYILRRRRLQRPIVRRASACSPLVEAVRCYLSFYRTSGYLGHLCSHSTGLLVRYLNSLTSARYSRSLLYNLLSCPGSVAVRRDRRLHELATRLTISDEADWLARQSPQFKAAYDDYCREFGYVFADTNPRDPHFRVDHGLAYRFLLAHRHRPSARTGSQWEQGIFEAILAGRFGRIHLAFFRVLRFIYRHSVGLVKEDRNHVFYLASARIRDFVEREQAALREELSLTSIEDLYFMTLGEITLGKGSPSLTEYRKRVYRLSRDFVDPRGQADVPVSTPATLVLTGIPCSPGIACGPVVFVRTRQDFTKAPPGSILVTDNLRPFWTPILASARGLLSSSGNILSHGASLAREHNVPAVFGLGEAVFSLRERETVTVNGFTGRVYRESP